jgi:hypothetical protein
MPGCRNLVIHKREIIAHVLYALVRRAIGNCKVDYNHCSSSDMRDRTGNRWLLDLGTAFLKAAVRLDSSDKISGC